MMSALLLGAGLVALALLLVLYWRTSQRIVEMRDTIERLKVMTRDMSADVRARLDEGSRNWENVEHEIRPRVEQIEPALADLSSTLEEHLPAMGEARSRLDRMEAQAAEQQTALQTELQSEFRQMLDREALAQAERLARIEEAVRTLRDAADERLSDVATRVAALEEPSPEPDPIEADPSESDPSESDPSESDPIGAIEVATDAPAVYGTGRKRMGKKARKPSRWRFWRSRAESAAHSE